MSHALPAGTVTWTGLAPQAAAVESASAPVQDSVTVAPTSHSTSRIGVVTFVRSSLLEEPLSEPITRSGSPGTDGSVVSSVTSSWPTAAPALPATSVWVAVIV